MVDKLNKVRLGKYAIKYQMKQDIKQLKSSILIMLYKINE